MELAFEQLIVAARLLLFAQLKLLFRLLDAAASVLSRRILTALDGALVCEAAFALEEELDGLPAALLALR
jgi:hypothetical protein